MPANSRDSVSRQRAITVAKILTALALVSFIGCGGEQTAIASAPAPATATIAAEAAASERIPRRHVVRRATARGRGNIKLVYERLASKHRKEFENVFREERLFEDVVENLNDSLVLPRNIQVQLSECNAVSAFYDPESKSITLCYELFEHFLTSFSEGEAVTSDEAASKAVAALVFTFYHELGHALIDVYDLPVTGREEDAVDQLATVILLETWEGEDSALAILASAEWFSLDSAEEGYEANMADEHSLDEQRYYNLVCWVYGSDPEYFAEVASDWELPAERAERCSSEYMRMSNAWSTLLGPHMRPTMPS